MRPDRRRPWSWRRLNCAGFQEPDSSHRRPRDWRLRLGGVLPCERRSERDLEGDLARTRPQRPIRFDPFNDLVGVTKFREEPLHQRLDLRQDGLAFAPRLDALHERLRIPDADGVVARAGDELLARQPARPSSDESSQTADLSAVRK